LKPPPRPSTDPKLTWEAIVEANRAFYIFNHAIFDFDEGEFPFPGSYSPRVIPLTKTTTMIGRRGRDQSSHPDIDLREAPEDRLVSHEHAVLELQADGLYSVTDRSTNGTFVNADTKPAKQGVPIRINDGDRIYVGAWTRILFRAHKRRTDAK
jgi:pSer/pThr/pTyr-binding forkhead associated (FHA) protein